MIVSLEEAGHEALSKTVEAVGAGRVVVVPTDTVYGIGCDAFDPFATARIFEIKGRPRSMPLPVLVARPRQAWALCSRVPDEANELAAAFWPGPLTMVLPEAEGMSWDLGETRGTIALRMPHHGDLMWILERTGPMAVTSANLTGQPTPSAAAAIEQQIGSEVALVLDGGPARRDVPSTIVDLTGSAPVVQREGAIAAAFVHKILGGSAG